MQVYQGTLDILKYKEARGGETEIYLDHAGVRIPVPLYFWKVIHDPGKQEAVAFLGINNPYEHDMSQLLCENICHQLTWVNWRGLMACCRAQDLFEAANDTAPNLADENNNWPNLMTSLE